MERNQEFELYLNQITVFERVVHKDTFEDYKTLVATLLQSKDFYLFEDEVLKQHKSANIEQVLQEHPLTIKTGAHRKNKDGSFSKKYMDLAPDYFVQPKDFMYDVFFAYKLRQLDLLQMDGFLDYHLSNYYDTNLQEFSRFLRICIRKHEAKLLNAAITQTIGEWITDKESKEVKTPVSGASTLKNSRIKRGAYDNMTCLSQEQTVLFTHYLKLERVILNGEHLTDTETGKALNVLTGYSEHSLRQNLKEFEDYQTQTNLNEINNLLTRMQKAIKADLKGI
jgi:hypothetical protein